jgi:malic enzyme
LPSSCRFPAGRPAASRSLERYIYLIALADNDETLFYEVVVSDPARFLPIVYDPTVDEACLKLRHSFRGHAASAARGDLKLFELITIRPVVTLRDRRSAIVHRAT